MELNIIKLLKLVTSSLKEFINWFLSTWIDFLNYGSFFKSTIKLFSEVVWEESWCLTLSVLSWLSFSWLRSKENHSKWFRFQAWGMILTIPPPPPLKKNSLICYLRPCWKGLAQRTKSCVGVLRLMMNILFSEEANRTTKQVKTLIIKKMKHLRETGWFI